ncbi:hypothetical protein [Clostridium sp. C2-6-12]|uniref:hypothetical protein n=1 Tax=Clostridium sp. C2-6-12 TaxID=2698832 RepID=UPI0013720C58|nr:hypothetical protein [Clostridium sp. C2-6-12]
MIKKFFDMLNKLYDDGEYLQFILYIILVVMFSFVLIIPTYYAFENLFLFVEQRFDEILVIVGGYVMFYLWWKDKTKNREEKNMKLLKDSSLAKENNEKVLCESNYVTIRQCLFSTLLENAEILNLKKPEKLSELDSPSKIISKGNVYMCQFVLVKNGEINSDKIQEMLQLRIVQKLNTFEYAGIQQTSFIYNGNAYPILLIDEVCDNGTFVQIDITWASEKYCDLLNTRAHAKMQQLQPRNVNVYDKDF